MGLGRLGLGAVLALCACAPGDVTVWFDPPQLPAGARAVLLIVRSDPVPIGQERALSHLWSTPEELHQLPLFSYAERPRLGLVLASFTRGLDELGVEAGAFEPLEEGRELPAAQSTFVRDVDDSSTGQWAPADEGALGRVRLPELDVSRCLVSGGCVLDADPPLCTLPCEVAPNIDPPAPPEPPAPPTTLAATCPAPAPASLALLELTACAARATMASCAAGTVQATGSDVCVPVGPACPAGDWADNLPASGPLFVKPDAPAGGDGSRASPFNSIADAIAAAPMAGADIALAKGLYRESLIVDRPIALSGACGAGTVISAPGTEAVVQVRSVLALSRLTLKGGPIGVLVEGAGRNAQLTDVIVEDMTGSAIYARQDAELTLANVVWRRSGDRGLAIETGARVLVDRVISEDDHVAGIAVHSATTLLSGGRVVVRRSGIGLGVFDTGTAVLEGVVIEDVPDRGVFLAMVGTATISDLVLKDTLGGPFASHAVLVDTGSFLSLQRAAILRSSQGGIRAARSTLHLSDVRVEQAGAAAGLWASDGSRVHADRLEVMGAAGAGVQLTYTPENMLRDVHIADVVLQDLVENGRGVTFDGATATLSRLAVERCMSDGVYSRGASSQITLFDVSIADVGADGATFNGGSDKVTMLRSEASKTGGTGFFIGGRTALIADSLRVSQARGTHNNFNGALSVRLEATIGLRNFDLSHNAGSGLELTPSLGMESDNEVDQGIIQDNAVGIRYHGPLSDFGRGVRHVRLIDNVQPIEEL